MKLCFSTLGCPDRSLEDILSLANEYHAEAIEIRGIGGTLNNTEIEAFFSENQARTHQLFREKNVRPILLGTSCRFHLSDKFEDAIAEGISAIRIARAFDIPYIRVFGDRILSDGQACIDRVISGLQRLCRQDADVSVLLEVHGDFNTVGALSPVLESMKNIKNFGLIWDIEHTHQSYGDNWSSFYRFARPYIKHVHIKDYSNTKKSLTLIGEGDVPIAPIVSRLNGDGYDGYLSLEWEKKWHPELDNIELALKSFISLIEKTEKRS